MQQAQEKEDLGDGQQLKQDQPPIVSGAPVNYYNTKWLHRMSYTDRDRMYAQMYTPILRQAYNAYISLLYEALAETEDAAAQDEGAAVGNGEAATGNEEAAKENNEAATGNKETAPASSADTSDGADPLLQPDESKARAAFEAQWRQPDMQQARTALEAAWQRPGGPHKTFSQFVDEYVQSYRWCHGIMRVDRLAKELKSLRDANVMELLEKEMPRECHLVQHWERYMDLLKL